VDTLLEQKKREICNDGFIGNVGEYSYFTLAELRNKAQDKIDKAKKAAQDKIDKAKQKARDLQNKAQGKIDKAKAKFKRRKDGKLVDDKGNVVDEPTTDEEPTSDENGEDGEDTGLLSGMGMGMKIGIGVGALLLLAGLSFGIYKMVKK